MQKYNEPGQIHFVTFRTNNDEKYFVDEICCQLFLKILDKLRQELKFKVFGFCILYDHIHLLIQNSGIVSLLVPPRVSPNLFGDRRQMPNEFGITQRGESSPAPNEFGVTPEENISYVLKRIKGATARELNKYLNRSGKFWKHRFYDFNIYSDKKFQEKLKYIHGNPVKHGIIKDIADYKYCSWRNYELNDHSIFKINYLEY